MCGISAIYKHSIVTDKDISHLRRMNQQMKYRGPDDDGLWHDERVCMALVRLSIIGLQKGKQPLQNEDKSLVLVCNGEIYNYIELKQDLIAKGHIFDSDSDSETILHLYEEYGDKCVDYLRGMFAFCLYDKKNERMIAVRDRIGEKTLYYAQVPCGVVFSTELKTILKEYIPNPQVNIQHLLEPIRYVAPLDMLNTWIEQIKRVQPGQMMIVDKNGVRTKQYWKYNHDVTFYGTREEAIKLTLSKMQESVDFCLRSDVPVAVMLSGGIDSSAIAALAKRTGREVHTITVGFAGQVEYDERAIARRFAEEQGLIYHELEMRPEDYDSVFEEFTQYIDEPITDSAAMAQWALYKKVKSHGFKVLLGGLGGDELCYGYAWINNQAKALERQHQFDSICPIQTKQDKNNWFRFAKGNWQAQFMPRAWHMINEDTFIPWYVEDFNKFINGATIRLGEDLIPLSEYVVHQTMPVCPYGKELETLYDDALQRIMVGAYIYCSDRLGMGNSIEIRSPWIDYKLVEHFMGIPVEMKGTNKQFLKDTLRSVLPDYILNGRKCGFTPSSNYPQQVSDNYKYNYIQTNHGFYASALADRMMSQYL